MIFSNYLDSKTSSDDAIDVRSKFFLMLVFSITIFFVESWAGLGFCFLIFLVSSLLLFFFDFKRSPSKFFYLLKSVFLIASPIYVLSIFTIVFNSFSNVGGGFSEAGLLRGLFFASRMILLIWYSLLIANTIGWSSFADVLSWVLAPLKVVKFPVDDIVMTASIALRFLPDSFIEFQALRDAAWCRGASLDRSNVIVRTKAHCACLIPLLVSMIRKSEDLSLALCIRSYGLFDVKFRTFERIGACELAVVSFLSLCLILVGILL